MELENRQRFLSLHRRKPHVGPLRSFTNRFRVPSIVLLTLDERLHIGGWN